MFLSYELWVTIWRLLLHQNVGLHICGLKICDSIAKHIVVSVECFFKFNFDVLVDYQLRGWYMYDRLVRVHDTRSRGETIGSGEMREWRHKVKVITNAHVPV